jgi:hypothetical protein
MPGRRRPRVVSDSLRGFFSVSVRPVPPPVRTDVDDTAARASARDAWVASTRHYFVEGCTHWRTQPEYALGRVRLVVEGLVHVVCVELEPKFNPHERGKLRRLKLEDGIRAAKPHLPPDRLDLVNTLKNLGNIFHHNQGVVQRSTPKMALHALLQCASLLEWLDQLLRDRPPQSYLTALRDLESAAAVATPIPPATAVATPLPPAIPRARPAVSRRARWPFAVALMLAAVALVLVLRRNFSTRDELFMPGGSPEVAWVKAYNDAIAAHDVDRILALHVLPAPRYFMLKNVSEPQLRSLYEGWYKSYGKTHETGFRACELVAKLPDGSRAVRCDTYIEPPLEKGPSVIPACLVFRPDGHVVSRTEIRSFACPPPP